MADLLKYDNYYAEAMYMTAEVDTGVLRNRAGRRMLALTTDFFRGLRNAFATHLGDRANHVMNTCGRMWGKQFGEVLAREWHDYYGIDVDAMPAGMVDALLKQAFSHHGWGLLTLSYDGYENGVIVAEVEGAMMRALVDEQAGPTEPLLAGILGGLFTALCHRPVKAIEIPCTERTGSVFVILSEDQASWVELQMSQNVPGDQIVLQALGRKANKIVSS